MIRRELPTTDGEPRHWVLVEQVDHARLSAELAAVWGNPGAGIEPVVLDTASDDRSPSDGALHAARREALAAIRRHDDGWLAWDRAPRIDAQHARPIAFTEMAAADAQGLWSESIASCRAEGLLAGWLAASHFSVLQSDRDRDWSEWSAWVERVDADRSNWLADWLASSPSHSPALAQRTLMQLRALDWASLWLCLGCPSFGELGLGRGLTVLGGGDDAIVMAPRGDGAVALDPWPLMVEGLELETPALRVPAKRYATTAELLGASEPIRLGWRLDRGPRGWRSSIGGPP